MPLFKKKTKTTERQALFSESVDSTTFSVPEDPYLPQVRKIFNQIKDFSDTKDEDFGVIVSSFNSISGFCQGLDVQPYCVLDEVKNTWCLGWTKNGCNMDLFTFVFTKERYNIDGVSNPYCEVRISCYKTGDTKNLIHGHHDLEDGFKSFFIHCLNQWSMQLNIINFLSQTKERADYLRQLEEHERPSLCSKS